MSEPAWSPGAMVVCVDPPGERTDPVFTPPREGVRYRILAARDADLGPPKGAIPDEIRIDTGDGIPLAAWWSAWRFSPARETRA